MIRIFLNVPSLNVDPIALWIAVEISSTTGADQEMQNYRKCLDAGCDYVFSVCDDEKKLSSLKSEVRKNFTFRDRERIRLAVP